MKTVEAFVGARGIDSEPYSHSGDLAHAQALKAAGIDFVILYLGSVTAEMVANITSAGLAFMPVTYADTFDGPRAVAQMHALGLPAGCTVWLDMEGTLVYGSPLAILESGINTWATAVIQAGFEPGLYAGSPQPLTSLELYRLKVVRYWRAYSRVMDRFGQLAEPACGWTQTQIYPSREWAGVWSDVNFIGQDFRGRLPHWVVA